MSLHIHTGLKRYNLNPQSSLYTVSQFSNHLSDAAQFIKACTDQVPHYIKFQIFLSFFSYYLGASFLLSHRIVKLFWRGEYIVNIHSIHSDKERIRVLALMKFNYGRSQSSNASYGWNILSVLQTEEKKQKLNALKETTTVTFQRTNTKLSYLINFYAINLKHCKV